MVKPARVPKQNNAKKNFQNISAEENAQIEEKIEALRSEVDSIQDRSKTFNSRGDFGKIRYFESGLK